jgi:putative holliday junction resolvase
LIIKNKFTKLIGYGPQHMGRILAIDYGSKRVGLAVSDPLRIIAGGLAVVHSREVISFLEDYLRKEQVDVIVVGEPKTLANRESASARFIEPFVTHLRKKFPGVKIDRYDERFTSAIAKQTLLEGGVGKKGRMEKEKVDLISAIIILQDYMTRAEGKH